MPGDFKVEPGGTFIARVQIKDKDATGLFPQTKIYDEDDAVVKTVNLNHVANGLYTNTVAMDVKSGKYYTQTLIYKTSARTTLSGFIAPDSDSIDVNHHIFRPQFGAGGGTEVVIKEFTEEELEKIITGVSNIILPELKKKSEFNYKKDIVSIDDTKILTNQNLFFRSFDNILNKIPKAFDEKRIISFISKIFKKQSKDISANISLVSTSINGLNSNLDRMTEFKNELDKIEKLITIISTANIELEKVTQIKKLFDEINSKLIDKDKLDDQRIRHLEKLIKIGFRQIAEQTNNEDLKVGIGALLNNSFSDA